MFNIELINAVESFASLMLPLTEKGLEHEWVWKDHDKEGIRFAFFVTIQELRQLAVHLAANRELLSQVQIILGQYHRQYMDLQSAVFGLSNENSECTPVGNEWPVL